MTRDIEEILYFRGDISPFLVHLTKNVPAAGMTPAKSANDVLMSILAANPKVISPGRSVVSDAKYGIGTADWLENTKWKFFGCISFTETPLNEVHCLLDIRDRAVNLKPYGLVFLKERLRSRGVSPCWYMNNERADKDAVVRALCTLIETRPDEAAQILPLIAVFGQKLKAEGAQVRSKGIVNWLWEREWRSPYVAGPLSFDASDVFVGLCPHEEIEEFKQAWPEIDFIDPQRNMKWYASKLVEARRRLELKYSVV